MAQERHKLTPEQQEALRAKGDLTAVVDEGLDTPKRHTEKYVSRIVKGPDDTRVSVARTRVSNNDEYLFHMHPPDNSWLREVRWQKRGDVPVRVTGIHEGEPYDYELSPDKVDEVTEEISGHLDRSRMYANSASPRIGRVATNLALRSLSVL